MIRKWGWIREYCVQQGFKKSAEIADQIDRVLCYLYGDNDTHAWEMFIAVKDRDKLMSTHPYEIYDTIIENTDFCIACESSDYCSHCKFSDLVGGCGKPFSLFYEFEKIYFKEEDTLPC